MEHPLNVEVECTAEDTNPEDEKPGLWNAVDIVCGKFYISIVRTEYEDGSFEEILDYKIQADESSIERGANIKKQGPWLQIAKVKST